MLTLVSLLKMFMKSFHLCISIKIHPAENGFPDKVLPVVLSSPGL